jgi:hypothetical protein
MRAPGDTTAMEPMTETTTMPRKPKRLTAMMVEAAAPRSERYEMHDPSGLTLRIYPSGAKSWA